MNSWWESLKPDLYLTLHWAVVTWDRKTLTELGIMQKHAEKTFLAHYYVRTYGSEEYIERGNFWGYFPFNDSCIGRTLEGLSAVSMQEKANGAGPGVVTLLSTMIPLLRVGWCIPLWQEGPSRLGESTAWAGSQGICSIPMMQFRLWWWRRAAEHSMFLLISVGIESRAASLTAHGAEECALASSSHMTVRIVYNNWGFCYYAVINAL